MTVAIVVGVGFRIRNNTSSSSSRKIVVTNGSKTGAGRGLGACDSDPSLRTLDSGVKQGLRIN